ncbi:MAG: MFS transporter [Kouleothrix sp.]|nr:MFS transporter [Kouleothrix sp.]
MTTTRRPPTQAMIVLLAAAFLNTIGVGIFLPVLPFIVQQYVREQGSLAISVGWLASIYAICQLVAAPVLGALSDRYGRRPILLLCLLGSALGYALFGLGGALWVLFAGRIIDGLTGGNFSILSAYLADLTEPEDRGRYFGMVGATAGAGFIVGPALGGYAARLGYSAPAYLAAAITALSLLWGLLFLPESLPATRRAERISLSGFNLFGQLRDALGMPQLRWLLLATFLFSLPFAILQSTVAVLIIDRLGWGADTIGLLFLLVGAADILMQGVLAGRLLSAFGEVALTIAGLVCEVAAYLLIGTIALLAAPPLVFAGVIMYAVGTGLLEPASRGLLSRAAGPRQQGLVQGANQSVQSLAMVLGPVLGGVLYTSAGHGAPYWLSAGLIGLAILAMLMVAPALRAQPVAGLAEA